jgi:hypothetical protein
MCCCGYHEAHHQHGYRGTRFFTREERAKELEEYAGELKKELTAVEEQIKGLKR